MNKEIVISKNPDGTIRDTYYEKTIGKTTYRVTSTYLGIIDLKTTLEDLIVRKVLQETKYN